MVPERDGSNSFDGKQLETYLKAIDKADDRLVKLKVEHMEACKGPRGSIRNIMKEARETGVNMAAFRAVIAKNRAERKLDERLDKLEDDDVDIYEAMLQALGAFGDTDLGKAALSKAKRSGSEKLDTLHS